MGSFYCGEGRRGRDGVSQSPSLVWEGVDSSLSICVLKEAFRNAILRERRNACLRDWESGPPGDT